MFDKLRNGHIRGTWKAPYPLLCATDVNFSPFLYSDTTVVEVVEICFNFSPAFCSFFPSQFVLKENIAELYVLTNMCSYYI